MKVSSILSFSSQVFMKMPDQAKQPYEQIAFEKMAESVFQEPGNPHLQNTVFDLFVSKVHQFVTQVVQPDGRDDFEVILEPDKDKKVLKMTGDQTTVEVSPSPDPTLWKRLDEAFGVITNHV